MIWPWVLGYIAIIISAFVLAAYYYAEDEVDANYALLAFACIAWPFTSFLFLLIGAPIYFGKKINALGQKRREKKRSTPKVRIQSPVKDTLLEEAHQEVDDFLNTQVLTPNISSEVKSHN